MNPDKHDQGNNDNSEGSTGSSGGAFGDKLKNKVVLKDNKLADNNLLLVARKAINRLMAGAKALISSSAAEGAQADKQRSSGKE